MADVASADGVLAGGVLAGVTPAIGVLVDASLASRQPGLASEAGA